MPRLLRRNRGNDDTAESEENGATAPAIEAVARMASAAAAGSAAEPGIAAADAAPNAAAASFARGRKRKKSSGSAAAGENEGGARPPTQSASKKGEGSKKGKSAKKAAKKGKSAKTNNATNPSQASGSLPPTSSDLPRAPNLSHNSLLSALLLEIQSLSSNKARCTHALNALMEGKVAGVDMPADHEVAQLRDGHDESSVGLSLATVFSGDSYNLMSGMDATATSSTGEGSLAKGKKRATSAEKESVGSGGDGGASSNASRDAHLFMAVTQAINVLISFFKKQEDGRSDIKVEDDKTLGKNGAILLAAFSHYLLKALICDRITMETITKASCGSSSSSSSPPNISQFYHSAPSAVGSMNVTSDFGGLGSISRTGAFCPSIDSIDAADPFEEADATRGKRGGGSSSPGKVEQQLRKNRIMSHAKAVVGRGMTSGVMGALWAIETLGNLTSEEDGDFVLEDARKEKSNNNDSDAEEETATAKDVERSLWRKSMWSSLIALETAFQMNTRPKLLTVSAVAASTNTRGVSGGRAGSGMTMMDFDGMVSAASTTMMAGVGRTGAAAGSSGSGRGGLGSGAASSGLGYSSSLAWNHAHSMMGADTIAMWNRLLQRILLDCEIGFHWLKEDENSDKTHKSNAQIEENDCLANICQEISGSVFCAQEDALFLSLVLVHHGSIGTIPPPSPSEPPATKKSRRSVSRTRNTKNTGRSDNHEEEFHELSLLLAQRPENHVMFDAHVSVRRWAVLAFSWLCKGQKRLLETCTTIFASSELWESVMELPPFSARTMPTTVPQPSGPMASVTKSKSKKKKKKEKEIRGKRTSPSHIVVLSESQDMSLLGIGTKQLGGLPGNVALVTFVCCMIDMIYDAGSPSGLSPTSGWMDDYVKAVTEIRDSKAELGETTEIVKVEEPAFSEITLTTPSNTGDGPVRRSARTRSKAAAAKSKNEKAATSDTRSSSKGASKKSPNAGTRVWSRPDVRHETAVLTKYLMEAHNRCLTNNFRDKLTRENPNIPLSERGSESKRLFMNDDDFSQNSALPARDESNSAPASAMTFYPFVHRSLETLGRTAASSSFFASSDAKSRIMAIGSAIALSLLLENFNNYRNNSDGVFVLDAKLYSVAIMQLSDCLESVMLSAKSNEISTVTSSSGNDPLSNQCEIPADVLKEYHLNHPLDIKSQNARDAANSEGSSDHSNISFCSYGGAFPLEADNSNAMDEGVDLALGFRFRRNDSPGFSSPAEIISLFIRAQLTLDGPDTNCKSGMVSLLKSMFAILHSCYDFRPEMHFQGNDQSGDSVTKKKASTGKRKKRKAGEFTSVLESKQPQETRLRKTLSRCALASDTLNTIRKCLAYFPEWTHSSTNVSSLASLCLRSSIRQSLSSHIILEFVKLGYLLEDKFIFPRLVHVMDHSANSEQKGLVSESAAFDSSIIFEVWERRLWSSHVKLSLTIGRGQAAFSTKQNISLLQNSEERLRIFQCIITAERERQFAKFSKTKKPKSDSKPERWPLHLPAVQHALIASTLSSITKPLSQEMDGQAELLLCNSFLNSIEDFVGDLSLLPPAEMRPMSQESNNKKPSLHFSDHILMSLRDARLFTLALGKLSHIDQKRMLTKLIDILHNGLHTANVKSRALEMITLKVEASRFIARVITLCASLVDIISSPELFQLIAAEIGSTHYSLPRIKQKMTPGTERCCFSKEECFQGLFADWESPLVPVAEISFTGILQESEFKKLEEVLQSALGVGFKASSQDGCHILSSSWNAAAKLSSWTSLSWEGPAAPSTIKQCSFVQRMMKLRDEMCEVHYLVNGQDGSTPPDTLLTKIVQNKRSHCRPNEAIIEGLSASEHMLANLTLEVSKLKLRKDLPPLPSFAYYEALPLYVSFLISMHTLPGSNDMGSTHRFEKSLPRRKKTSGYTDDDDIMENLLGEDSDDSNCSVELDNNDSENTSRINALSHLHDACITLGAAPCYPDWLDANCRMREGMNPPIAVDSADRALSSLMQFGTAVFKCYAQSLQHALNILELGASQDHFSASSSIALKLIFVRPQTPNDVFDSLTSSLCQISSSALKLVTKTLTSQLCSSSNDFCLKSVHRIIGAAMNEGWEAAPGEHRANGQWETLVSETLEGSSLRVAPDAIAEAISYDANVLEDIATALVTVCRWRRVLYSIVSAMVPTTALLRFGVNDAKGRKPHSLCEGLSGSRFSHSSENNEGGTQRFSTKNQVGTTIKNVLSFLSCISAHSANDVNMHLTARAAADHLLEDCSQFHDLESLWKVRIQFEAISGVLHGLENEHIIESQKASASTIIEMMLGMNNGVSVDKEKLYLLLSCFGMKSVRFGRLIGNRANVDLTDILAACGTTMDLFVENEVPGLFKQWGSIQTNVAHLLINLLCQGKAQLQASSRSFVTSLMNDLMEAENCFLKEKGPGNGVILRYAVASSLDELSKDDILRLVDDICLISSTTKVAVSNTESEKKELSEKLAIFINYLASVPRSADGCEIILNSLLSCMDKWANSSAHDHVMNLTCTLASRFGELHQVGKRILTLTSNTISEQPNLVNAVKVFFQFVVSLDKIVNHSQCSKPLQPSSIQSSGKSNDRDAKKGSCYTLKGGADILRTCSYVNTGESFSEQHWYNCYTCGLLWDKGCCSLCVRVCHKGHDVGYSRKSSFFCDCGAESATAVEQNRTQCQCLSPLSDDRIQALYEETPESEDSEPAQVPTYPNKFTQYTIENFPTECKQSLLKLVEDAKRSKWDEILLLLFTRYQTNAHASSISFTSLLGDKPSGSTICTEGPNLISRSAVPLNLEHHAGASFLPIRAAKANALQLRMISDSTNHIRKNRPNPSLNTQLIASDDRGRLIIAESTSVLFCSAIPHVNTREYPGIPAVSHLSRSQLNILGSDRVKFQIFGMTICPENNRHVLFWGASEACVAIVSSSFDSFEQIIYLTLQLEPTECESEYLLKCEWMPESELMVVAICGTVVHVFDLKRIENSCCKATTHYALAYEDVLIRSAAMTGCLSRGEGDDETFCGIRAKLALLLDTGRMHFIELAVDEDGDLEDQGENYIECGAGASFPSAGIRRYNGGSPMTRGSTTSTLGEGVFLTHLRQSNLLIYQCISSCCVAMLLDSDGAICGSFELLPHSISSDTLLSQHDVSGPYSHFQELGVVIKNGKIYYRVTCVGKSTRSNQPRLLFLEFNESAVYIRELSWPLEHAGGLGLSSYSSHSFVGSCAFSAPYLVGGSAADGYVSEETRLYERAFLTMLSSNGSLFWFGEDCLDIACTDDMTIPQTLDKLEYTRSQAPPPSKKHNMPRRISNIHIFEELINVSEADELVFGGDCVGKDPKTIKKKLSLNNNDFVVSPSRDGCTLTASLKTVRASTKIMSDKQTQHNSVTSGVLGDNKREENNALAIVAVRVLVGSMPDSMPREIIIMGSGRAIKLKNNVKRWYDFPLSDEEILLGIRNGFVSMWISPCHNSTSSPIIDSVEVYARARDIAFMKSDLFATGNSLVMEEECMLNPPQPYWEQEPNDSGTLVSCIQSLTFLTQILRHDNTGSMCTGAREQIKHVIERTALWSSEKGSVRDHAIALLSEIEVDSKKRACFIDEATLFGLMTTLQGLQKFIQSESSKVTIISSNHEPLINRAIDMLSHILRSTISIARTRGGNYRKAVSGMIAAKVSSASIAVEAKNILDVCQYQKSLYGVNTLHFVQTAQLISELILIEIACSDSSDFAQFDVLASFLMYPDSEIVKACCAAISNSLRSEGKLTSPERVELSSQDHFVTYQCDSCRVFPITGRRYTLGGEVDVDLCKDCFEIGIAFARSHDFNDAVVIHGRTLCVENEEMTCEKIWQMSSKAIAAPSLDMEDAAIEAALKMSRGEVASSIQNPSHGEVASGMQEDSIEVLATEGFRSQIFTQLLNLAASSLVALEDQDTPSPSYYVLQLVIDIVLNSDTEELKVTRGNQLVLAFTKNMQSLIKSCQSCESSLTKKSRIKMVVCVRTLASLVMQKNEINFEPPLISSVNERNGEAHTHHKDKTDPRFVCEAHGVPAVRRRCSHGVHKDRRFYVCGLERKHRCNYFKWSSDVPTSPAPETTGKSEEDQIVGHKDTHNIFTPIQGELLKIFSEHKDGSFSLQHHFCDLVGRLLEQKQESSLPEANTDVSNPETKGKFDSLKSNEEQTNERDDGVLRSKIKFGKSKVSTRSKDMKTSTSVFTNSTSDTLLCSILDLLQLVVSGPQNKWSSDWFSVLCEIISTNTSNTLRGMAKKMLQRMCGGRRDVYHRVRDHYVFAFSYRKLLQQSKAVLDVALDVREQARQCGPKWRDDEVTFESISASGLLGVEDLISEDCYTVEREESISAVLEELLEATRARGQNWRQFCCLPEISAALSSGRVHAPGDGAARFDALEQIYHRSPIISLLWLGSCLRGANQIKVLTLIDIALADITAIVDTIQTDDVYLGISSGTDEDDYLNMGGYLSKACNQLSNPELCLVQCLTIQDLHAFITQFVLQGRTPELRSVASSVAYKLAGQFPQNEKNLLFGGLIDGPLRDVGQLGSASVNFFDFLQLFIECFGSELDLSSVATCLTMAFGLQMTTVFHYCRPKMNGVEKSETEQKELNFDLSNCVNCHKQQLPKKAPVTFKSPPQKSNSPNENPADCGAGFLPDQVRPYQKSRLEASTVSSVSSEFSSYTQLKCRVALSQVQVTVSDPRGRLVKTIGVYFTPRQVSDVNDLKSDKYLHLWQRCGILTLARGASEASFKLKNSVIAANLKFTYESFYEKLGGMRAPDGSLILHCPRCTRQVNNAHGVCGNCGEVAYQCRKCRHINYDRLDAFLCVECGYCPSGVFNYEVTVGIALNAVAILDEDGFQRSMAMLRIANKRQGDIKNSLRKKMLVTVHQDRVHHCSDDIEEMILYGPALKRAFMGGVPKSGGFDGDDDTKPGSASAGSGGSSSRLGDASSRLSRANKARSLISLARQLRAENSAVGSDSHGRGDFLVRQALLNAGGAGGAAGMDFLDDVDESLFSALSASGGGGGGAGAGDPLSRLVANIHARVRSTALGGDNGRNDSRQARGGGSGGNDGGGAKADADCGKDGKIKQPLTEECNKLYSQMREAERECYELNRRIDSWNRLNRDALASHGPQTPFSTPFTFIPTSCSSCSAEVTLRILQCLLTVFVTNISDSKHIVNGDLIKILFNEPENLSMKLMDLKRLVIITLATTSEAASKLILHELQSRLQAVQDVTSAELLGKLIELDFPLVDQYIDLAISTLQRGK